jgi:hypothetical protein
LIEPVTHVRGTQQDPGQAALPTSRRSSLRNRLRQAVASCEDFLYVIKPALRALATLASSAGLCPACGSVLKEEAAGWGGSEIMI